MLEYYSPGKKKPHLSYIPTIPAVGNRGFLAEAQALLDAERNSVKSFLTEAQAREKIIKNMVLAMKYKVGDFVVPATAKAREEIGTSIVIEKIVDSYAKYGRKEKWPDNNVPLIVHAYAPAKDYRFYCTPSYLVPFKLDGSIPDPV